MTAADAPWLTVIRGEAPLVLSLPHTGTDLPDALTGRLVSAWHARKDTDWWIDRLYAFAGDIGATVVHTSLSRTLIDVNRDPAGGSLYPGMATTALCPTTTFDGESLYLGSAEPGPEEIAERTRTAFAPYHAALAAELSRLRRRHARVVLYDAHSIRSEIPRLFAGLLPHFNIGTSEGASCDPALTASVAASCASSGLSHVVDGRFKGGYITRHYGRPGDGVHAIQMEIACRTYMPEAVGPVSPADWPPPWDADAAAPARHVLRAVLAACLAFCSP